MLENMKISRQLGVIAMAVAIPLLLLGAYYTYFTYNLLRHHAGNEVASLSHLGAILVSSELDNEVSMLGALAQFSLVREHTNLAELRTLLEDEIRLNPRLVSLFITDRTGRVLVRTGSEMSVELSDRDYFQEARRSNQAVVSGYIISRVTGKPVIVVAQPLRSEGSFNGILGATIGPDELSSVFNDLIHPGNPLVTVYDQDGIVISSTDPELRPVGVKADDELLQEARAGRLASGTVVLGGVSRLVTFSPIPDYGWTLSIGVPLESITGPIERTTLFTILAVILLTLVSLFLLRRLSGVITRPLYSLVQTTRLIGEGKLEARAAVPGRNEISDLAASVNGMAARLQQAEQLRQDLLSVVSHDLLSPLSLVSNGLDLAMQEEENLSEKQRSSLEIARRQLKQLQEMSTTLLEISRLEGGRLPLQLARVDVRKLLEECLEMIRPLAERKGLSLTTAIEPGLPEIDADPGRLRQVFLNLLDNAVKYTERGGITVTARLEDGCLVTDVTDTGAGIPPEEIPLLFQRFYRLKEAAAGKERGTGLGLYIVRLLVQAHGGSVGAASAGHGQGSTFTVRLPVSEDRCPPGMGSAPEENGTAPDRP